MRRREFLGVAGAAVVGAAAPDGWRHRHDEGRAQVAPSEEAIARLIEAEMARHRIPGVAFGLVKDDTLVLRGFGLTNLDNPQPVDPDTVFPIASISKTVVATAMMRLVEDGRLDLEAPVRRYLPDFRIGDEAVSRDVRVVHLLTHTPGWEGQLSTPDRGPKTLAHFVDTLKELPGLAPAGAVWSYNNAGFGVAGRVIEVITGDGIGAALSDLVFQPLGLTHAFTRTGAAMTHRFAAPHREEEGRTAVIRPFELPVNVPAGGAAMSVASLMAYARFHLGDGTTGGRRVLRRETLEGMRRARLTKNATTDAMGVGWHLRTLGDVQTAAHGGTLGGHCLHVQLVPARRLAFAILTNHNAGWRLIQTVERAILETYEGLSLAPGQLTGGNRGGNEDMTVHAAPLPEQPAADAYVGRYTRPPNGTAEVVERDGRVVMRGSGVGERDVPLVFWGADVAYTEPDPGADYPYVGMPIEFVRRPDGRVGWVRVNGRIAVREA